MGSVENTPPLFARLISAHLATLYELQTVYSLEDAYKLDEILLVDNYTQWLVNKREK